MCGCENGATCNPLTGQCVCPPGYYGDRCELFDYCGYYEDHNDDHVPACSAGNCCLFSALPYSSCSVCEVCVCVIVRACVYMCARWHVCQCVCLNVNIVCVFVCVVHRLVAVSSAVCLSALQARARQCRRWTSAHLAKVSRTPVSSPSPTTPPVTRTPRSPPSPTPSASATIWSVPPSVTVW